MKPIVMLFALGWAALAGAGELPEGVVSARLLPGWTDGDTRVTALHVVLERGWKTYWRSPGEAGVPPEFDFSATDHLSRVDYHWPRPEVFESAGVRTLGFHDEMVLPITLYGQDGVAPTTPKVDVALGVCLDVCVPVQLSLIAPPAGQKGDNPLILAALDKVARPALRPLSCRMTDLADGVAVEAILPTQDMPEAADSAHDPARIEPVFEAEDPAIWVSEPEMTQTGDQTRIRAEFVAPSGAPFALDPSTVRLTFVTPDAAISYEGCAPIKG